MPFVKSGKKNPIVKKTSVSFCLAGANASDTNQPADALLSHRREQDPRGFREQRRLADVAGAEHVQHGVLPGDCSQHRSRIERMTRQDPKAVPESAKFLRVPDQRSDIVAATEGFLDERLPNTASCTEHQRTHDDY
jgi:hypothetical protein